MKTEEEKLESMGWSIVCYSPFEVEHEEGSHASGQAARYAVDSILEEYEEEEVDRIIHEKEGKKAAVKLLFGEDFEGDGSDEEIENILREWLRTHKFKTNSKEMFEETLRGVCQDIGELDFSEKSKMDGIISELVKAKTYMK